MEAESSIEPKREGGISLDQPHKELSVQALLSGQVRFISRHGHGSRPSKYVLIRIVLIASIFAS